jgi:hypothetical protein
MSENNNYKEEVEERLRKQQESKEFKDIGRVAHTKKEKAAYRLISSDLLSKLEDDSVLAYQMVKKENVWQPIDVNLERENGVSSGAAFYKVKIRESVPTRPKDEKQKRASYVLFLELLQKDLTNCKTVSEIRTLMESYREFPLDKVIGYFIDSEFLNASVERQEEIKKTYETSPTFRVFRYYGGASLVKKLINEVFGSKFENMLFRASDAANDTYKEALSKEPVSHEKAEELIAQIKERRQKFINANIEKIEAYRGYSRTELFSKMRSDWRIGSANLYRYKENPEEFRTWVISYYEKAMEQGVENFDKNIAQAVQKENDWSWFEQPKGKSESVKEKAKAINTKTPLGYIKRTGGYKIEDISPKNIIEQFGFSAVNYGVYVDDVWSKEHTRHFLGAMSDLGEMINVNLKQMNNLGKLGIAFGAKGRPGHLAAYYPQSKDINLTKGNGDGSLAHEWGHYFDNVIVELDKKVATNSFASDGLMPDLEIKQLFKEFIDFAYKGNEEYTPKVPVTFYRKKITEAPTYVKRNAFGSWDKYTIQIKSTIEETIDSVSDLLRMNGDLYRTQIRVFGYILDQFNLDRYEILMKIPTSYFYHKSKYNSFVYCGTDVNGNEAMVFNERTKYWTERVELFARAWETVILKKLLDKDRASNYLVADIPMTDEISESNTSPYPQGKELEYVESIFDRIIIAVKNKFGIGGFVAPSSTREDVYLDLSTDKTKGKVETGLVVTNPETINETTTFIEKDKVVKVVEEKSKGVEELKGLGEENVKIFSGKMESGQPFLFYVGKEPENGYKSEDAKENYNKNGYWIDSQLGFNRLITAYFKDYETMLKNTDKKYHSQLGVEENLINSYIGLPLQVVEDKAYALGKQELMEGKSNIPEESSELQKMLQAGHAANVIEKAWLNGWNSANADKIDREFEERFKEDKRGNEVTTEENISELIEGLKVLSETLSGSERKEIEEVIEGLKLLM